MPHYIALLNLTEQGIRDAKSIPQRIEAAQKACEQAGATWGHLYMVTGQYDYVLLFDAPDDQVAANLMLAQGTKGNIRSQTSRAFDQEEIRQLISKLA